MKLDNSVEIKKAVLFDPLKGKEVELHEREGSKCHFLESYHAEYGVILRIDWSDINERGDPSLDADIYKIVNGKRKKLYRGKEHHTTTEFDEKTGYWAYKFKFKDLELSLILKRTQSVSFNADIIIADPKS